MDRLHLGTLDFSIIVAYFIVVLFIGFWVARKTSSDDDLFLAGRRLVWPAIGFSLFASNISSTTLIGLSGAAYSWGVAVANYEWMAAVVLVFFVIFIVPLYINSRIGTVPEFLERRFDKRSRLYFSGLTVVANIIVDTAGSLFAGAMVLKLFFPELSIFTSSIVLAIVAGIYTAAGGLAAVVYTDIIQAVILLIGSVLLTVFAFGEIHFSWAELVQATPEGMLSFIRPLDDPNLPWLGTLIGVPVLGFYFWVTNQFIVQRVLGAKGVSHARWGALFGGLLKLPVFFIMVLPGTMARIILPNLPNGDMVFPSMVAHLLPAGLTGLVLAGLAAAIMSSIDSTLNSASALVTLDFIKPHWPELTPKQSGLIGRIAIVVFMLMAAGFAPVIGSFSGLFYYLQSALSYLVPPVAAVFLVGIFWRRGGGTTGFVTLLGGHLIALAIFVLNVTDVIHIHFTIIAGILFFASAALFVVVGLLSAPPSAQQVDEYCYHRERDSAAPEGVAWYADYRILSGGLIALTAALVIAFW